MTTLSQLRPAHEGQRVKDRALENTPPTPKKIQLKEINDVQKLIVKEQDAMYSNPENERKKAASQSTKAQASLSKDSDLEASGRLPT